MMDKFPLSLAVFFGLFGILMLYDLFILIRRGYPATVSATLYKFSQRFPIIPFLLGGFFFHVLWPNLGACIP